VLKFPSRQSGKGHGSRSKKVAKMPATIDDEGQVVYFRKEAG